MRELVCSTDWYKNYRGQVQGALKLACQNYANEHDGEYRAVAVLVAGGPVSMVEDATMQEIQQKYQTFKLLESTLLQKRYVLPHTFPSRAPGGA